MQKHNVLCATQTYVRSVPQPVQQVIHHHVLHGPDAAKYRVYQKSGESVLCLTDAESERLVRLGARGARRAVLRRRVPYPPCAFVRRR